jgi:hypothetical protein
VVVHPFLHLRTHVEGLQAAVVGELVQPLEAVGARWQVLQLWVGGWMGRRAVGVGGWSGWRGWRGWRGWAGGRRLPIPRCKTFGRNAACEARGRAEVAASQSSMQTSRHQTPDTRQDPVSMYNSHCLSTAPTPPSPYSAALGRL